MVPTPLWRLELDSASGLISRCGIFRSEKDVLEHVALPDADLCKAARLHPVVQAHGASHQFARLYAVVGCNPVSHATACYFVTTTCSPALSCWE